MSEGRALARAALAGNPSDMYGGAVLGVTIPSLAAAARVGPVGEASAPEVAPNLVQATWVRFSREFPQAARGPELAVTVSTNIPRSVGLGGSSAIVIALLRALCQEHSVELGMAELAELALSIERDDLGIAAGLQDRVTQAMEGVVFMDFAAGRFERLAATDFPPLLIAWRTRAAEPSGQVHGGLQARWEAGDAVVRESMTELAELALDARTAVIENDVDGLCRCVDGSYDARARMLALDPQHVEMVEVARRAGAAVNYTGSGGAIVCVCRDPFHRRELVGELAAIGCGTLELDPELHPLERQAL